jgi:hypothetical protein
VIITKKDIKELKNLAPLKLKKGFLYDKNNLPLVQVGMTPAHHCHPQEDQIKELKELGLL